MTFNPTIPKITASPKNSANAIRVNFAQFASIFSSTVLGVTYNHMPFNDQNQGKHAAVILQNQANHSGTVVDGTVLYSHDATSAAFATQPQLFTKIPKFLPTAQDTTTNQNSPVQITYNFVKTAGPQYQSFLIGGYLLYVGSTNNIINIITVTPKPTKILCVLPVSQNSPANGNPYDWSVTVTQPDRFKINSSNAPAGTTYLWMAIASV
jgi:hypothetical protein